MSDSATKTEWWVAAGRPAGIRMRLLQHLRVAELSEKRTTTGVMHQLTPEIGGLHAHESGRDETMDDHMATMVKRGIRGIRR